MHAVVVSRLHAAILTSAEGQQGDNRRTRIGQAKDKGLAGQLRTKGGGLASVHQEDKRLFFVSLTASLRRLRGYVS